MGNNRPVSIDVGLPQVVANVVLKIVSFCSYSSALGAPTCNARAELGGGNERLTLGGEDGGRSPHKGESRANGRWVD